LVAVQGNHVHLVVEAEDERALARGLNFLHHFPDEAARYAQDVFVSIPETG